VKQRVGHTSSCFVQGVGHYNKNGGKYLCTHPANLWFDHNKPIILWKSIVENNFQFQYNLNQNVAM
jgi:hypothetical protein